MKNLFQFNTTCPAMGATETKEIEMKTETTLKTTTGQIQYFASEAALLEHYNRNGRLYEIQHGRLYHKSHRLTVGEIETIKARAA